MHRRTVIVIILVILASVCIALILNHFLLWNNITNARIIQVSTKRPYSVHDNEPYELNLVIAKYQQTMECEAFEADPWIVYNVPRDCFESYLSNNKVLNRLVYVAVKDEDDNICETPAVINDIFKQIEHLEHDLMTIRIYNVKDEFFVYVELNVNWWTPCSLYYYNQLNKRLIELKTFSNRSIEGIKILSTTILHELR